MPVTTRISDAELRHRLEDHAYNVPPITDTTRAILIKKLNQLDQQQSTNLRKPGGYTGLDYNSADEEEFPPPIANSTRKVGRSSGSSRTTTGNSKGGGSVNNRRHGDKREEDQTGAITSRVTRSSRSSRSGTPQNGSSSGKVVRRTVSLMTHSETEEGSEEDEEEEEGVDEEEDESEEEEEDIGVDRVDLGVQTSLMDSPSPAQFRGQRLANSSTTSHNSGYSTTPNFPVSSPYLRKNINKHGSLSEALSTLPPPKSKPTAASPVTSTTQVSPRPLSQSYSQDSRGPCSYMVVSSLIMAVAVAFFLFLLWQYLSLVPPQAQPGARVPVCAGIKGELPHVECVPSSQLNQTVQMYKQIVKLLPSAKTCVEEQGLMSKSQILDHLAGATGVNDKLLKNYFDNLLVLLRQNPSWGVKLVEESGETSLGLVVSSTWACTTYKVFLWWIELVGNAVWAIVAVLIFLVVLFGLVRLNHWRQERTRRREEEVFTLVRQVTNFLYQQHQGVVREGKGGPSYLAVNHLRDQLIPPQERSAKAEIWAEVVEYIQKNESRVRQDVQKIFGEDFRVWQWLPEMTWSPGSPPSHGPSPPSTPSSPSTTTTSNPWPYVPTTQGEVGWQGCAFPLGKQVAAPIAPPTSCLKVRHMFDVLHQQGPGWVAQVKEEIILRCSSAKIVHIAVDTTSEDGIVYIKTAGMEEAGKVFRCLHGQWYRGQLVTAKYLRLERYHERFPDAKSCSTPLST